MQEVVKTEEVTITKEQVRFYVSKKKIAQLEEEMRLNPSLKTNHLKKIDDIKHDLFKLVLRYGMREISLIAGRNLEQTNSSSDARQDLAVAFFEHLPSYDPLKSAPITYFARHFRQAVSERVRQETGGSMSQYDVSNLRKIRSALYYYESMGIEATMEMLVKKTELSPKVISNTLQYAKLTKSTDVEEATNLLSSSTNPEEVLMKKERFMELADLIREHLTDEQWLILKTRWNPDGSKELSYKEVSEKLTDEQGRYYSMKEVKSVYSKTIQILQQHSDDSGLLDGKKRRLKRSSQQDAADVLDNIEF